MKTLILTAFGCFIYLLSFAQVPSAVDLVSPTTVKVCEANRYSGFFPNGNGSFTLLIKPVVIINSNNIYSANCANSGQNNIGEFILVTSSGITFIPTNNPNEWTVTINSAQNFFEFDFLVDCSILSNSSLSGTNAFVNSEWLINGGSNINTSNQVQLNYPFLLDQTDDVFFGNFQGTLGAPDLIFSYQNTGSEANILFDFNDPLTCGKYTINNVYYEISNNPIPSTTMTQQLTLPAIEVPITLEFGEYLHIKEKITITGCLPCNAIQIDFSWKCFNVSQFANACNSC